MTDPTTPNVKLVVPVRGSNVGTWDVPVNSDMSLIDAMYGSITTKSLTSPSSDVTLSESECQVSIIRLSGLLVRDPTITFPSTIMKTWTVENNTTGPYRIRLSGGSGNAVAVPPGSSQVRWDGTNMGFVNLNPPMGGYFDYAGTTVPVWITACDVPPFLMCDGSTYSSVTYPLLFAILGSTTLPDMRGRSRFNYNSGTARVNGAGGVDGDVLFSGGGFQEALLSTANLPAHNHTGTTNLDGVDHTHATDYPTTQSNAFSSGSSTALATFASPTTHTSGGASAYNHTHAFTSNNTGSDTAHNNMPPAVIGGITMIRAA